MHVYVVGKGAVGTYLGELLRGIGNDVTYAPRAIEDIVPVDADLSIVAVKSYDTPGAIATLQRALRDPGATTILTAQNGIGNEEALAAAFGADNVVAAALTAKEVDGSAVGPLLDQVSGPVASFTGDGAYDQDGVSAAIAERHPEAAIIVRKRGAPAA